MDFLREIGKYSGQPLTRQILLDLLRDYRRPFDKISELVAQNILVQVKKGLFIPGHDTSIPLPENFLLANHLWGPSYVSSDSALSYWGMIPERVYESVSATTNRSKLYKTPVGRFRYFQLPLPYYSYGIDRVELALGQVVLIAGREQSLCDKIVSTPRLKLRSKKQTRDYLIEDLRISIESLQQLNTKTISEFLEHAPKRESISILIKTLEDL